MGYCEEFRETRTTHGNSRACIIAMAQLYIERLRQCGVRWHSMNMSKLMRKDKDNGLKKKEMQIQQV
jgi:hypothetical protein